MALFPFFNLHGMISFKEGCAAGKKLLLKAADHGQAVGRRLSPRLGPMPKRLDHLSPTTQQRVFRYAESLGLSPEVKRALNQKLWQNHDRFPGGPNELLIKNFIETLPPLDEADQLKKIDELAVGEFGLKGDSPAHLSVIDAHRRLSRGQEELIAHIRGRRSEFTSDVLWELESRASESSDKLRLERIKTFADGILPHVKKEDQLPVTQRYLDQMLDGHGDVLDDATSIEAHETIPQTIQQLLDYAYARKLDDETIKALERKLPTIGDFVLEKYTLESFFDYLKSALDRGDRQTAVEHLHELAEMRFRHRLIKFFVRIHSDAMVREVGLQRGNTEADGIALSPGNILFSKISPEDLAEHSEMREQLARRRMAALLQQQADLGDYRHILLQCLSPKSVGMRADAAYLFLLMAPVMRAGSIAIGMAASNHDRPFSEWGTRFVYEVVTKYLSHFAQAKILTGHLKGDIRKIAGRFAFSRSFDVVDAPFFNYFIHSQASNIGREERRRFEEAQEFLEGPLYQQEREGLILFARALERREGFELFKNRLLAFLGENLGYLREYDFPLEVQGVDWENLTREDLENEFVQGVIMGVIAEELYLEMRGVLSGTGNRASDRYIFDALYGIPATPANYYLELRILENLCLRKRFSFAGPVISASILFFAKETAFNLIYYPSRSYLLGF